MGFAGTEQGSFFRSPPWVKLDQAPGTTSQAVVYGAVGWWKPLVTGRFLPYSPNLVWLAIAAAVYVLFPYDFEAARAGWAHDGWVLRRAAVNAGVVFGYFGFWHVTLYWLGWGERPFVPNRAWKWGKVIHNVWYTALGALQWTAWECVFVRCYATGRLPHVPDAALLGGAPGHSAASAWLNLLAVCFLVPLYREVHFYLAHRLIHVKVLYKYVHSLHHRNTDIEPFAGLCMHPIEHLYYYSCVGPALYCHASPFLMTWLGIHLIISPAASHSGYEDNMQSDQFHYLHHRFFECNYGTGGMPLDKLFGTFRDRLPAPKHTPEHTPKHAAQGKEEQQQQQQEGGGGGGSTTYRGAADVVDAKKAIAMDARATLAGAPDGGFALYMAASLALFGALAAAAAGRAGADRWALPALGLSNAQLLGAVAGFGPVALGAAMLLQSTPRATADLRRTLTYPFHKEPLLGAFGANLLLGLAVTAVPVYHTVAMLLAPPGQSAYCQLWGCPAA